MREWAYNQGAAQVIEVDDDERLSLTAGRGRRAGRPRPPRLRDGPASTTSRRRWRRSSGCPRRSAPGSASTTTPTAPSARRASPAGSSRGCAPTSCPTCSRSSTASSRAPARRARRWPTSAAARAAWRCCSPRRSRPRTSRGYDISQHALDLARAAAGRGRRHQRRVPRSRARRRCRPTARVDFVTTFDCIHDMTDPAVGDRARSAPRSPTTAPGCSSTSRPTTPTPRTPTRNPMASLMYGISVLSCMSSRAVRARRRRPRHPRACQPPRPRRMARDAGFTRFRPLEVDHPINAFYEIRP